MSRHVEHLLAAYVDGQLSTGDTARVFNHLRGCQPCRDRLSAYESLSDDLRLTLSREPQASRADMNQWWGRIGAASAAPRSQRRRLVFAPALALVAVLGLLLVAGLSGLSPQPAHASDVADSTRVIAPAASSLPVAQLIPSQAEQPDHTTTVIATAAPQENAATAAPAPLAPSVQ